MGYPPFSCRFAPLSMALGAGAALSGLDNTFPLPRMVHHALAGVAPEGMNVVNRKKIDTNEMMCLAMYGALGGYLASKLGK